MLPAVKFVKLEPIAAGNVAGNLASGTVPDPRLLAFKLVKADPFKAGRVAGNLASGTVPEPKSSASKLVKADPLSAGSVAGNLASGIVPELRLLAFNAEPSIKPLSLLNPEIAILAFVNFFCAFAASTTAKKSPSASDVEVTNSDKSTSTWSA